MISLWLLVMGVLFGPKATGIRTNASGRGPASTLL